MKSLITTKPELEKKSLQIALAAIKFSMLSQDPNKLIVFNPEKELQYEGDTGPYIQYTHARICSILKKASSSKLNPKKLDKEEEKNLITKLSNFPSIVEKAGAEYKPSLVANYLLELSRLTNEYYHKYQVLKAPKEIKSSRLYLIDCIRTIISNGLHLLSIEAIKSM